MSAQHFEAVLQLSGKGINRGLREASGATAGEPARFVIELDAEERTIEAPPDMQAAVDTDVADAARFAKLSFTHRREFVEWVEDAKKPETRERRIAKTVAMLRAGDTR